MDTLGQQELWAFFDNSSEAKQVKSVTAIRKSRGHRVDSFLELATKIAELQFRNREHVLMFRGQDSDYRNAQNKTTLKPSLFRPRSGSSLAPGEGTLMARFDNLRKA